jgi:iron-sulfur cluster repair protein YtfE (RIC family)
MLRECHERIRRFASLAAMLPEAHSATPAEIASGAESVARYFAEALPQHVLDEDEALAPALLAAGASPEVRLALADMTDQHRVIEDMLVMMIPLWRTLAASPGLLAQLSPALAAAQALRQSLEAHLRLEESVLFPAAEKALTPDALREMGRALRDRRQRTMLPVARPLK